MTKSRRPGGRFEVEWVTVSYRAIVRWAIVLGTVAAIVGAALLWQHLGEVGRREEIGRLVSLAERELETAREAGGPEEQLDLVVSDIENARGYLAGADFRNATASARTARRRLRSMHKLEKRAQFLRVEGDVQVKRVGTQKWLDARVGLALNPGDLVKTGSDSGARFENLDGSAATLRADTLLRIERSAKDNVSGRTDVAVVITSGRLTLETTESQAPGSTSEVKTPNVSASVESNTVLGVGFDEAGALSEVNVIEGNAKVATAEGVIDVGESERVSISADGVDHRKLPAVPLLVAPPPYKLILTRDLVASPATLEWESVREARSYRVEMSATPLFTKALKVWEKQPSNYVVLDQLEVGRYYWRVSALDRDGIAGGPSTAYVFRVSDALPEGDPPNLEIANVQSLGESVFLFEGRTQPGVFLSIDDGHRMTFVRPQGDGEFRQVITIPYEGEVEVTVTARNSQGLEASLRRRVVVDFD